MNRLQNTKSQKWVLLAFFVFSFYYFGVVMMTYFVSYPQLQKVTKNIHNYMQLFNDKMFWFCYLPAVLMIISQMLLLYFCSKRFSRVMLRLSFGLASLSVLTTFLLLVPIHNALPTLGLTEDLNSKLLNYSMCFQIIPAAIQVLIALVLFNTYLNTSKTVGRVLFIVIFFLCLYSLGTLYIESLVGYPMWLLIDPTDWLVTREAVGLNIPAFIWVFLIPVYLPLLLLIPMFWKRPQGISKYSVLIMFLSLLWVFVITAVYFVPDIQAKLTVGYSKVLIQDLNKYDFPLRGIPDLIYMFTVCYMFIKIKFIKENMVEN